MKKTIKVELVKNTRQNFQTFAEPDTLSRHPDYIILGTGKAVIEMFDHEHVTLAEVSKLKQLKKETLAEQCLVIEAIEHKIQSLLAISHDAIDTDPARRGR